MLPWTGDKSHPAFSQGHFILPDTNVFLSQVYVIHTFLKIFITGLVDGPHRIATFCATNNIITDGT
jgi:hypothetical protein